MAHDFDRQKAESFSAFAEMQADGGLPDVADVDYFFVPQAEVSDWRALADALSRLDYLCEFIEEDGEAPYLVARLPDQAISASGIWIGEEVATRAALAHGFAPDGWGLEG